MNIYDISRLENELANLKRVGDYTSFYFHHFYVVAKVRRVESEALWTLTRDVIEIRASVGGHLVRKFLPFCEVTADIPARVGAVLGAVGNAMSLASMQDLLGGEPSEGLDEIQTELGIQLPATAEQVARAWEQADVTFRDDVLSAVDAAERFGYTYPHSSSEYVAEEIDTCDGEQTYYVRPATVLLSYISGPLDDWQFLFCQPKSAPLAAAGAGVDPFEGGSE